MFTFYLPGFSLGSPESAGLTGDSKLDMNVSFFPYRIKHCVNAWFDL